MNMSSWYSWNFEHISDKALLVLTRLSSSKIEIFGHILHAEIIVEFKEWKCLRRMQSYEIDFFCFRDVFVLFLSRCLKFSLQMVLKISFYPLSSRINSYTTGKTTKSSRRLKLATDITINIIFLKKKSRSSLLVLLLIFPVSKGLRHFFQWVKC